MPRKHLIETDLIPGTARLVFQLYEGPRRRYRQPAGYSLAGVRVQSPQELERLWRGVRDFVDGATWRRAGG